MWHDAAMMSWALGLTLPTPDAISTLLGALIGGGISLLATRMQLRADRRQARDDQIRDAYLAYIDWFHRFDPPVKSFEDDRAVGTWDAGVCEARTEVFGSSVVRKGLGVLRLFRTSDGWGDSKESPGIDCPPPVPGS
jgi:hypothetical protein